VNSLYANRVVFYTFPPRYGQDYYTPEDLLTLFREMDAVGLLFPDNDSEMIDVYTKWRKKHHNYWFNKWWDKYRRPK